MTFVAKFKIKEQDTIKAKFTLDFKPSKVSQLENDLHFQTEEDVASTVQSAVEEVTIETDAKITEVNQTINNLSQTVEDNYLDLDNKITVNHQELTTEITEVNQTINNLSQTVEDNYLDLDNKITVNHQKLDNHTSNKNNPHEVTKTQIGLGNVDNTSDLDKPVSNATHIALDTKVDKTSIANRVYGTDENGNQTTYSYETFGKVDDVRVDGISVVTDKIANLGSMANENSNDYSTTAEANSLYAEKSLETIVSNHTSNKNNPHEVTKTQIGLGNVDNTSDLDKPVSNAVQSELSSLSNSISSNYTSLNNRITEEAATLNTAIATENTQRQSADNNLQSQIDAITSAKDVTDIVGTYEELENYDTSGLAINSIIKVISDSTHDNAASYYMWNGTSWEYKGSEGPYVTPEYVQSNFVNKSTTINNKSLTNNIVLTANDVGALPNTTIIGNGTLTIQVNGKNVTTFTANQTGNTTANIITPSVDQTFDGTSENAQSGIAIAGELNNYVKSEVRANNGNGTYHVINNGSNTQIGYSNNDDSYILMQAIQEGSGIASTAIDMTDQTNPKQYGVITTADGLMITNGITEQNAILTVSNNNLAVNGSEVILRTDIDSSLSTTSENPVQNKAIAQAIENITLTKNPNLNLIGGNLNIDSGNVSSFSTTDYMQFPFVFNFNGYTWTLEMGFTTGLDITTQQNILDSYYGVAFAINNGKFLMALSSNGSSWNIGSASGTYSVQANTAYSVKIAWDGSNYTLSYALDETNYTTDISIASAVVHHSTQEYVGGEPELFGSGSQHPFTGVINLNNWSLIVNGLEVWLGMDDVGLGSRANIDLSNLTEAGLAKFQAPLISGENIKTINNESILGSGNITIQSGGTVDQTFDGTSTNAQSGVAIQSELTNYVKSQVGNASLAVQNSGITIGHTSYNDIEGNVTSELLLNSGGLTYDRYSDNHGDNHGEGSGIHVYSNSVTFGCGNESNSMALTVTPTTCQLRNEEENLKFTIVNGNLAINGTEVQEKLVSGTSIKTINNQSLLGSGNIGLTLVTFRDWSVT